MNDKFNHDDVKIIGKESMYKGFFECNRYHFTHKLFSGETSPQVAREVFERGNAVAVLPYDPIRDQLVLLEQFRFPAMQHQQSPWLTEIVAGIVEPNETQQDVAYREAKEEANIELEALLPIYDFFPSPGACTEMIHLYLGKVDSKDAGGIYGLEHEAEDIKVECVSLHEASEWLATGKICNAAAIIALQWLLLNKQSVLDKWTSD